MKPPATPAAIRGLRPAKPEHDPWRVQGTAIEREPGPDGEVARALTIFLTGAECPFTCVFCDLWRHTLDGATPPGAIPHQIRQALASFDELKTVELTSVELKTVKLYNASNWFDERAVPARDDASIADLVAPRFERVVVECHPRFLGPRCERFAERLRQRESRLEVALGFECVHPEAMARSGKRVDVDDLRRAARRLRDWDVDLRAFVLVGAPFVPLTERPAWTERTVALALELGAVRVSLVPVREVPLRDPEGDGRGALGAFADWTPPDLAEVEESLARSRRLAPGRVAVDPWDLEALAVCEGGEGGEGGGEGVDASDMLRRVARLRTVAETGRDPADDEDLGEWNSR